MPTSDGHGDCVTCGGKCCRYVTVQIERPTRKVDVDEVRWFLAHENIEVFIEDGEWYVQVYARCKHLTDDDLCTIYQDRFGVCRGYDVEECEDSDGEVEATIFRSVDEFDAYLAKKRRKRAKKRRSPPVKR